MSPGLGHQQKDLHLHPGQTKRGQFVSPGILQPEVKPPAPPVQGSHFESPGVAQVENVPPPKTIDIKKRHKDSPGISNMENTLPLGPAEGPRNQYVSPGIGQVQRSMPFQVVNMNRNQHISPGIFQPEKKVLRKGSKARRKQYESPGVAQVENIPPPKTVDIRKKHQESPGIWAMTKNNSLPPKGPRNLYVSPGINQLQMNQPVPVLQTKTATISPGLGQPNQDLALQASNASSQVTSSPDTLPRPEQAEAEESRVDNAIVPAPQTPFAPVGHAFQANTSLNQSSTQIVPLVTDAPSRSQFSVGTENDASYIANLSSSDPRLQETTQYGSPSKDPDGQSSGTEGVVHPQTAPRLTRRRSQYQSPGITKPKSDSKLERERRQHDSPGFALGDEGNAVVRRLNQDEKTAQQQDHTGTQENRYDDYENAGTLQIEGSRGLPIAYDSPGTQLVEEQRRALESQLISFQSPYFMHVHDLQTQSIERRRSLYATPDLVQLQYVRPQAPPGWAGSYQTPQFAPAQLQSSPAATQFQPVTSSSSHGSVTSRSEKVLSGSSHASVDLSHDGHGQAGKLRSASEPTYWTSSLHERDLSQSRGCRSLPGSKVTSNAQEKVLADEQARMFSIESQLMYLNRSVTTMSAKSHSLEHEVNCLRHSAQPWEISNHDSYYTDQLEPLVETFENEDNLDQEFWKGEFYEASLAEDTFSFLISSKPASVSFATGLLVFVLKNSIFALLLTNLILDGNSSGLQVPVSVEIPVVLSQFLAFAISVLTQNDLITSLVLMYQGYSGDMIKVYGRNFEGGGRRSQWRLSVVLSFLDGLFGLVVTFFLIVTSTSVLEVLLNFAAVEFVAALDEAAFYLAQMGFLGLGNKQETEVVSESKYRVRQGRTRRGAGCLQTASLLAVLTVVLATWAYMYVLQVQGLYNAKKIIVQFDDEVRVELGAHSGLYSLTTSFGLSPSNRFQYKEDRGDGRFGYCLPTREWTFVVVGDDPCDYENVLVKSESTDSFDLLQVADQTWSVVREGSKHALPMRDFFMEVGCDQENDCGGSGHCTRNVCVCHPGFFGFRCEHRDTDQCPMIQIDENFGSHFPARRPIATTFNLLGEGALMYSRPIYVNSTTKDVIVFTGVRWAITNLVTGFGLNTFDELARIDENRTFDANSIASIDLLSDAVPYLTRLDLEASPTRLGWNTVEKAASLSEATVFPVVNRVELLCAVCNDRNPCSYGNQCVEGKCECSNGATGLLCHIAPNGNGNCDPFFNTPEFGYDSGDCCQLTCVSGSENDCGSTAVGQIANADIGYSQCIDPSVIGPCEGNERCYIPIASEIAPLSSDVVYPTLSANGKVLVVGEPSLGIARVFDLVGAEWIQRGSELRGAPGSGFGRILSIASPPGDVLSGPGRANIPLFVAGGEESTGTIRVFEWNSAWVEGPSVMIESSENSRSSAGLHPAYRIDIGFDFTTDKIFGPKLVSLLVDNGPSTFLFERRLEAPTWSVVLDKSPSQVSTLSADGSLAAVTGDGRDIELFHIQLNSFLAAGSNASSTSNQTSTASHVHYSWRVQLPPQFEVLRMKVHSVKAFGNTQPVNSLLYTFAEVGVIVVMKGISSPKATKVGYYTFNQSSLDLILMNTLEAPSNVTDAVFSSDGTSVALVYASEERVTYETVRLDRSKSAWIRNAPLPAAATAMLEAPSNDLPQVGVNVAQVSISNDGTTIVDGTSGSVEASGLGYPRCAEGETTVRISLDTNESPEAISWRLFSVGAFKGFLAMGETVDGCDSCFSGEVYSWNVVAKEVCVPKSVVPCLGMTVSASFELPTNGFAAYVLDEGKTSLFATDSGRAVNGGTVYRPDEEGAVCPFQMPQCMNAERSPLTVGFKLTPGASVSITLKLRLPQQEDEWVETFTSLSGSDVVAVGCLPSDACHVLELSYHGVRAGSSQDSSIGVFLGDNELLRSERLEPNSVDNVFIGAC